MKPIKVLSVLALAATLHVFFSGGTLGSDSDSCADLCAEKIPQPPAALAIKTERAGAVVALAVEKQKSILSISGADRGGAIITRNGDRWPEPLVLRVYLTGLEQLTIRAGEVTLSASVLSHGTHQRLLHVWKTGKEGPPVTKESPYWMEISIFDAQGKPIQKLPEKGGWFEMTIPAAMLTDLNPSVRVGWLAFFL